MTELFQPDIQFARFYEVASGIIKDEQAYKAYFKEKAQPLNRNRKVAARAGNHSALDNKDINRAQYQAFKRIRVMKEHTAGALGEALKPAAVRFFEILPAIQKAVDAQNRNESCNVTDFTEGPVVLTPDFCRAVLIGAKATGQVLTAQSLTEAMYATPAMEFHEAQPFPVAAP